VNKTKQRFAILTPQTALPAFRPKQRYQRYCVTVVWASGLPQLERPCNGASALHCVPARGARASAPASAAGRVVVVVGAVTHRTPDAAPQWPYVQYYARSLATANCCCYTAVAVTRCTVAAAQRPEGSTAAYTMLCLPCGCYCYCYCYTAVTLLRLRLRGPEAQRPQIQYYMAVRRCPAPAASPAAAPRRRRCSQRLTPPLLAADPRGEGLPLTNPASVAATAAY